MEYLVKECGADVNKQSARGWNSLVFAIFGGHLDVIDFLVFETDVDRDAKDHQEQSIMDIAMQ